jgi:V/A-type H+-transporting ATPase subunit D
MAIRIPPGRAGRLWLERRLEVATRGADVLDQKRRTLLQQQQILATRRSETEAAWERQAAEAARWNDRAATIAGPRRLRLAGLHRQTRAELKIGWRNALGAVFPADATVQPGEPPDFVALGGGSSVTLAAEAHAEALKAAAAFAVARAAYEAVSAELAATTRRLRAIERRWIPEHQAALRKLELSLNQSELEDAIRVRWVLKRQENTLGQSGRPSAGR